MDKEKQQMLCCYSRSFRPKVAYPSQQAANRAASVGQSVYPCKNHEGNWHVKTRRR